eukprot:7621968-Pyramimonas_sp.AAC.1
MQHWLGKGWTEHGIRHRQSLRKVDRNANRQGHSLNRTGAVKTQEALIKRDLKRAIMEERKLCRGVVCTCFEHADHGLGRQMRCPSRSPNFRKA